MLRLLIRTGGKKGEAYPIEDRAVFIGRDASNTIVLPDRLVSRKHAYICPQGSQYIIEDMGSVNGTLVNDRPVRRQILNPGDTITLGSTVLEFTMLTDPDGLSKGIQDSATGIEPAIHREPGEGSTIELTLPPKDVESLMTVPDHAEVSTLHKAYLQLAVMYRLIKDLVTVTDLGELMDRTAEMVLEIIKADRALIMLADDQSGELVPRATRTRGGLKSAGDIRFSKTISRQVFETGRSVLTSDAMEDHRFLGSESIVLHGIRSNLCVPIKTKERILGIIHVDTLGKIMGFSQEDLELLAAMGLQIGIAVENAKLVTDLRRANAELKEQQEQLIEAERLALLGKIAAGVAHEINNPITSVQGFTAMAARRLKDGIPSPEAVQECLNHLNIVQEEAQRCIQVVESISQFYRRKLSDMVPIEVNTVVNAALNVASFHITHGHMDILRDLKSDLPLILGNRGLLQQVLVNLLLNARDAMPDGGTLKVATGFEDPSWVTIRVSDSGCGIAPEHIEKIFRPLFTTKEEGKGTGIGLSISQDIIKRHNGAIEVESVPGQGTTFILRLPSADQSSSLSAA